MSPPFLGAGLSWPGSSWRLRVPLGDQEDPVDGNLTGRPVCNGGAMRGVYAGGGAS